MLVGIISDTHDNLPALKRALECMKDRRVEMILHAGDYVAPFTLKLILASGIPLVGVFGNNDGERAGLNRLSSQIHEGPYRFELCGRNIVMAHAPEALNAALQPADDIGVCGHTHKQAVSGQRPLILNPGEVCGWVTGISTGLILDLKRVTVQAVEFGRQETIQA
jgi:putative phosphoesterase